MTWGKLDDHLDDDPRWMNQSLDVFGLYFRALPYCLRRDANLVPRELLLLLTRDPEEHLAKRLKLAGLWYEVDEGFCYADDDWSEMQIPEEKRRYISEVRSRAGKLGADRRWHSNGTAMANGSQPHGSDAPGPGPGPGPGESPLANARGAPAFAARRVEIMPNRSNGTMVGAYVEACTELGVAAGNRDKARIGREAKRLLEEGRDPAIVRKAVIECARTNHVELLGRYVGDFERSRAGVDTSRHRAPPVNPIDAQIAAIRQRSQQTVIEVPRQ